jgi:hypothetical protein
MKAKKALKRLRSVEALLSIVIDQFAANEPSLQALLDSAKASVIRARARINSQSAAGAAKKPWMTAKRTKRSHLTAEGRKRISLAAKKRWALVKRTSTLKTGAPAKSAGERDSQKRGSLTPPRTKPAGRPLSPEASPETNQDRHESQAN